MTWHDYGSGLWCLQERPCSRPVAMVWRQGLASQGWYRGITWTDPPQSVSIGSKIGTARQTMDAIDRLRAGEGGSDD